MQQIGLGQLGMTEDQFWETTPKAFFNAAEGFQQLKRNEYELVRLLAFCQVGAWVKISDPKQLWKFSWETEGKKEIDKEKIEEQQIRAIKLVHTLRNRS